MTGLIAAELARLRARRVVWIVSLIAVVLLGLFQISVNDQVTPPTAAEAAQVEQSYQEAHREWADSHVQQEADCRQQGGSQADCAYPEPQRSDYGLNPTPYAEIAVQSLQIGTVLGWLALFLIGATVIGAEFSTGAIGNWLTFVPRRGRVLVSKLIAFVVVALLVGLVLAVVALGVPAALVSLHGGSVQLTPKVVFQALRGVGLGAAVGCVGFGIALVTRHTVGALAAALAYLVALFVRVGLLNSAGWAQRLTRWTPEGNLAAVFGNGYDYQVPVVVQRPDEIGSIDYVTRHITLSDGLIYTAVLLIVVLGVTAVTFWRRDVT